MTDLTVVKLGGSLLESATTRHAALASIAARFSAGEKIVLVHGGGKRIDGFLRELGIPKQTVDGLRVTDERTLDVVVAVLAGLVNKKLVAELRALGVRSAGFSGVDDDTLWAEFTPRLKGVDLGYVGQVTLSNPALVTTLLGMGLVPVLASVAAGRDGTLFNVNADAAAAALASALKARRLIFLTDVAGVLDASGKVVPEITPEGTRELLAGTAVSGGMRPKLAACLDAVRGGVPEVYIAGPGQHGAVLQDRTGGTRLAA